MSTDLQLRHDIPSIRLTSLKLKIPETQNDSLSDESCTVQIDDYEQEIGNCHTPTSSEYRIPEIIICPPAPKKQRQSVPSCKRKLSEFDFVELVARDEIDTFFKSSFEFINQKNKRCSSCKSDDSDLNVVIWLMKLEFR
ncbi:cyclin-dependent protein kinase inhibitor SMR3-like [Rutidosis leptorrhynchoides]|uniref:cyclin-dependent protein kinase inhibitor SMR3-like n=1 Tax=Rutidosis leptorrhynchoides TaxID=125765 RepID=UPI003A9907A9